MQLEHLLKTSALAALDAARTEARRQTRYLAAHILPTRAESPRYPQREVLLALVGLFAVVAWATLALMAYAVKDRR